MMQKKTETVFISCFAQHHNLFISHSVSFPSCPAVPKKYVHHAYG